MNRTAQFAFMTKRIDALSTMKHKCSLRLADTSDCDNYYCPTRASFQAAWTSLTDLSGSATTTKGWDGLENLFDLNELDQHRLCTRCLYAWIDAVVEVQQTLAALQPYTLGVIPT